MSNLCLTCRTELEVSRARTGEVMFSCLGLRYHLNQTEPEVRAGHQERGCRAYRHTEYITLSLAYDKTTRHTSIHVYLVHHLRLHPQYYVLV